jgi:DNA replication licensing factor MCM3
MVSVEGIVTKVSLVAPKLVKSVHYCPKTKMQHRHEYRDATSLTGFPTSTVIHTKDPLGNLLELEFGLSVYKNHQRVTLQEMPERAPLGQLPRSVEVILEDDLVDKVKPGDRVQASGIFRALGGTQVQKTITGRFRTVLVCNAIQTVGREVGGLLMTVQDIHNIMQFESEPDVFERLARSLAPSIYGCAKRRRRRCH